MLLCELNKALNYERTAQFPELVIETMLLKKRIATGTLSVSAYRSARRQPRRTRSLHSKTWSKTLCLPCSVTRGCEDVEGSR